VEYFSSLGSVTTNAVRCTREIKCGIAMAKAAFNAKKNFLTSKLDFNLTTKQVNYYILSIVLCVVLKIGHFGN
jgi:hypothetical protein